VKSLARLFAFGAGSAIGIVVLGELINLALALSAKRLDDIEDDGWVTLYPEVSR
jgi:hypothetical protein